MAPHTAADRSKTSRASTNERATPAVCVRAGRSAVWRISKASAGLAAATGFTCALDTHRGRSCQLRSRQVNQTSHSASASRGADLSERPSAVARASFRPSPLPAHSLTQDQRPMPGSPAEEFHPWLRCQLRALLASDWGRGRATVHSRARPAAPKGPVCPVCRAVPPVLSDGHSAAIRKCCVSASSGGAKTSCQMPENARMRAIRSAEQSISAAIATTLPMSLGEPR